jgi:hypothetical protein
MPGQEIASSVKQPGWAAAFRSFGELYAGDIKFDESGTFA